MNDTDLSGPCAGYEFEIVELHEGTLAPGDAGRVRTHLEGCVRCRDWQARHASLDAALARDLPRPALPADFHARLRERLAGLAGTTTRSSLRIAAEREHDWMVKSLRRSARRRAAFGAAASAAVVVAGIAVAIVFGPEAAVRIQALDTGNGLGIPGALGAAAVIGALAWSATRGVLPGVRLPG